MNSNLQKAIALLQNSDFTCVLCCDKTVYTSKERGVLPLLNWISNKTDLTGFSSADKVVGNAAAFLYVILGVKAVYAPVMSKSAVETFEKYGVDVYCDIKVNAIRNRTNTGFCPMENTVKDITAPQEALIAIQKKLQEINTKS